MITKPVMFYVLFIIAQLYGVWVFWYCAIKLKQDVVQGDNEATPWRWNSGFKAENKSKPTFYSDEIRKLIWLSIGEIPMLMILEYLYKTDSKQLECVIVLRFRTQFAWLNTGSADVI